MEIIQLQDSKKIVPLIVERLKKGEVLVVPTDTVYGLICDASNREAVKKIFLIKKREEAKPLAVFVRDIKMAEKYAFVGKEQKDFLKENWPGALTVILNAKNTKLSELVYKDKAIGLRQPNYRVILEVLKKIKRPLAQTSANISGQSALTRVEEVLAEFNGQGVKPDMVIDAGDLPENKPSKVVDFTNNKPNIIRP